MNRLTGMPSWIGTSVLSIFVGGSHHHLWEGAVTGGMQAGYIPWRLRWAVLLTTDPESDMLVKLQAKGSRRPLDLSLEVKYGESGTGLVDTRGCT